MNKCHSITEAGYSNCLAYTGLSVWFIVLMGLALVAFGVACWYGSRDDKKPRVIKPANWQGIDEE